MPASCHMDEPTRPPHRCQEEMASVIDARTEALDAQHFSTSEMRCSDGTPILLAHRQLLRWLDYLRSWAGAPVQITSGYRTHAYNRRIGGADESRHMYGLAADVKVQGKTPSDVADWADRHGFGGVGRYESFTHLDVFGQDRRWDRT